MARQVGRDPVTSPFLRGYTARSFIRDSESVMKHLLLLLLPLSLISLPSQADILSSGCSAKQVAIGSAVNGATGVNSRCSAASTKQRVDNAVKDPADYAKRKAAQATGVDEAYNKARNSKQRVENAVEDPAAAAGRAVLRKTGAY